MSILDIFRPAAPAAPAANPHVANNPQVPSANNSPQQQPTQSNPNPESPTDKFKDLWNTTPNSSENSNPNFQLAPEQLNKVASGLNFTQGISQEAVAKVAAGGEEAVQALGEILNVFGQNIFKTNAQFTSNLTEAGYGAAQKQLNSNLPTLVKQQLSTSELFTANPALRDPAIQPVVRALHSQLTQQHPEATPAEINGMLSDYMGRLGGAFNKADPTATEKAKGEENFDFSSFLS